MLKILTGFLIFVSIFLLAGRKNTVAQKILHPITDTVDLKNLDVDKRVHKLIEASDYYKDSLDLSTKLGIEALEISLRSKNKALEADSKTNLATILLIYDLYDQALVFGFEALKISEQLNDAERRANAVGVIGWIYYDADQADNALQYHRQAVAYYENKQEKENLAWSYNALGLSHYKKQEYDSAIIFFEKALKLGKQLKMKARISAGYNNLGMTYAATGNFEKAFSTLDSALVINREEGRSLEIAENLNQKGNAMIQVKRLTEANQFLEEARNLINNSTSNARKEKLLDNYAFSSKLFQEKGDYQNAMSYMAKYISIKEDILSLDKNSKLINAQHLFQAKQKEQEIELLEAESRIKELQRNFIAGMFLLLGIIGFILHQKKVNNQRKEIQIKEAKQALIEKELERASLEKETIEKEYKLAETQKLLAHAELEKSTAEKEILQNKLDFKNSEFTKAAIHLSQRNELIRSFLDELKDINTQQPTNLSVKISKLISHFSHVQGINSDAEAFHMNMEAEYKEFLFKLTSRFPELTENEKRLCSQIRLNLSIKDIASINNISVKSVEMARYRLRKKLGMVHDEGLADFLNTL